MSHKIDWKRGSASLIIMMCLSLLTVFLLVLYMVCMNIMYINSVAATRTDAIADSAALYAQSYDYKYNKSQAEIMTNLLTTYNNSTSDFYSITSSITFPEDNVLKIKTVTQTPTFYPDMMGSDTLYAFTETSVTSVDIYGDVLMVPEEIATTGDDHWRNTIDDSPSVDPDNADVAF